MDSDIPRLLAAKYAQFADDRTFSRMAEIMSDDFTQTGPGFGSNSLQEFIDNLELLKDYSATFHLVGNQVGEWHNEIYTGETWSVAAHIYERDGVTRKLDMGIRYQDVIENVEGRFRYTSRNLNVVWTQDLPCQG
ncbi:nuclear transport factor 2 family protein [Parahaliea sp. F7430]|uniref:Nuclear transport factor 2 family protein n=1 Tax=Sediminihaliea albiluteola TaxID=2758564 RepID=A0A7W2TVH9_9GAMM|nr:nuclear transport factor 2 family protein [Sediminihaliea albiluteola]MBA6412634.1 nuclear transport factor 2 family protein [Sediminihaliea albiluteola]